MRETPRGIAVAYDFEAFFEAVAKWQREEMGSHCTYCNNNNMDIRCGGCGFWGLVDPNDLEGIHHNNRPCLEDFRCS